MRLSLLTAALLLAAGCAYEAELDAAPGQEGCDLAVEPVADADAPLGLTESALDERVSGVHVSDLEYALGGSTSVRIEAAVSDARFVDAEPSDDAGGSCQDVVEADVTLLLSTKDGAFDEVLVGTLVATSERDVLFSAQVPLGDLRGTWTPEPGWQEVSVLVAIWFTDAGVHGDLTAQGRSAGELAFFPIAAW